MRPGIRFATAARCIAALTALLPLAAVHAQSTGGATDAAGTGSD